MVVTEFVRTARSRGFTDPGSSRVVAAMESALEAVMIDKEILTPFTSFSAREAMDIVNN